MHTRGSNIFFDASSSGTNVNIVARAYDETYWGQMEFTASQGILYTRTTGSLILGANNAGAIYIVNGGKVGIGTTDPGQKLHVNGNILVNAQILTPGGSNLTLAPNTGLVSVAGSLQASGAGLSSFAGPLTVSGNITTNGSQFYFYRAVNSGNPEFHIGSAAAERLTIQSVYASGAQTLASVSFRTFSSLGAANAGQMNFYVDNSSTEILKIQDTGITTLALTGTTATFSGDAVMKGWLTLGEDASDNSRYTTSGWSKYLMIDALNSGGGGIIWTKQSTSKQSAILSNHGKLEIGYSTATDNSAAWVPALTIDDAAKVGIGTGVPGEKLTVWNSNISLGKRQNSVTSYIGKGTGANGQTFGSNSNWIAFASDGTDDWITFGTHESGVGGGERVRIAPSGNVGIGTTAPAYKLDVNGAARIVDGISSPAFWFRPNAFSVHCWQPKGGWFHNQTNVHTGAIRIKLPPMHDAMVTFWVDVYDYADNESFSAYISGYPYQGTTWSHTSAVIIGGVARNFTVRFGDNNTAGASAEYYVYIGETNQSWNHIQVVVRDVFCGYHVYANEWDGGDAGWGVSFATSFANIAKTQSNTLPYGDYNKLINVPSGSDVTGSGTDNYVPRWNGTTALQNSSIYADDNGNVGVGNAVPGNFKLNVSGAVYASGSVVIANGTSYFGALNSAGAAQQLLALNASNQLLLGSSGIANAGYPARVLAKYITFEPAGTLGAPVETMRVTNASFNSAGKVGIGTTAPSSSLHVNSEISCGTNDDNRSMFGYELANSRFYIGTRQAGTNYFDTVTVKTGKVGIGTTTFLSNSLLEIYKASGNLHLRMIAADNASCSIAFRNATGNEVYCGMFGDQTGGINKFGIYNAGLRMVVDNAGKVGIATATPNYKLEVRGTDNNQRLGIQPNTATAKRMHLAYNSYLSSNTNWYGSYAGSTGMITFYEEGVYQTNVGGIGFNIDRIASDNTVVGVNPAPKMIITTDSKVGIGTAAPATPLHVWSTSYPQFRVSYNSSLYFTLDHAATLNVYGNDWYVRLNGSEKFRIKQDGKVGIGTNNPLNLLTLRQAAGANIRFENATTGRYFIVGEGVGANDKFSFRGNSYRSTDTLTVDFANNRVGIGTISPVSPLHVKGTSDTNIISIGVGHADGSVRSHWGYDSSGATMGFIVGSAYANDSAKFQIRMRGTASSDAKVTVLGGGEFGIGTSAPTSKLTIDDPSAQMAINSASCAIMIRAATALNQYSNIGFNYSGGAHEPQCTIGIQQKQWASYTYADLVFATRNVTTNTAPTERMRIEHGGKVGIGTTNPGYALDIRQAAGDVFLQSNTGTNRAGFQSANNGGTSYFYRDSSSGTGVISGSSVYATVVGGTGARSLHLGTYGTVKVTVTSDGNVGIGEAAPGAKLTVAGNAIITSSNPLYMGGNATAIGSWVSRQYATGQNHYLGCNGLQVNNVGYVSPATTFLQIYSTGQAIFRSIVNNHNYHYIDTTSGGYNPILGFLEAGTRRAYINYVSADNYLSVTTEEGSSDIAIMAAGKVGVGTTNPENAFEVKKSVTGSWVSRIYNTATTGNPYGLLVRVDKAAAADTHFGVYNGAAHTFAVKGDGNVGIGTPSPSRTLTIDNDSLACLQLCNATTGPNAGDGFQMQLSGSTGYIWNYEAGDMIFGTSSATRLTLKAAGQAIFTGDLTCSDDLYLNATDAWIIAGSAGNALTGGTLRIQNFGELEVDGVLDINGTGTSTFAGAMTVGGALLPAANGAYNLGGSGNYWASCYVENTAINGTLYVGQTATLNADVNIAGDIGVANGRGVRGPSATEKLIFHTTDGIKLTTGSAERVRIKTDGNVGIGTTNPGTPLEVNGRAMVGISPNDNNGNSDFSVGVGGSGSTIALYTGHIFMGGVDTMNWYFKLSYSGGSSRLYSWANDIYIGAGWNGTSASHDVVLSAATSNNTPSEYLRCDGSTGKVYFSKPAYFGAAVYDKNNSYGTSGQVLSTTGSGGVDWVTPSGGGGDTVSITTSADDILSVSSGAISGVDAGSSDKIVFWDNSQNKLTYLAASTGLYTNGTNLKVSSSVLMSIQDTNYNYCTPSSNTAGFYQGGSITVVASGNGVTFSDSTSSDYRLKSNISTFNSEAWTKVKSVNLRRFDFNESLIDPNSSAIIDRVGFIAHELAEAGIEGAVEGSKDEVDSDGNPVYQKVCLVKLVPVMWGALKEAITKIETLETKVQTLENS